VLDTGDTGPTGPSGPSGAGGELTQVASASQDTGAGPLSLYSSLVAGRRYKCIVNYRAVDAQAVDHLPWVRFNNDSGANYGYVVRNSAGFTQLGIGAGTEIRFNDGAADNIRQNDTTMAEFTFMHTTNDNTKVHVVGNSASNEGSNAESHSFGGIYDGASSVTSIQIGSTGGGTPSHQIYAYLYESSS
jgi:hypothetical protein